MFFNFKIKKFLPTEIGFDKSFISKSLSELFIFSDKTVSSIHPISPPNLELSVTLKVLAVFLKPIFSILFVIIIIFSLIVSLLSFSKTISES